jgi:anti-anti-sigma factor
MVVDVKKYEDLTLVKPHRDLKSKTVDALKKVLESLEKQGAARFALDLSKVKFIDSSAIGYILNFDKRQKKQNGFFCIFNYCDDVKELFDMIEIGDFITLYKTFEEMKCAFSGCTK